MTTIQHHARMALIAAAAALATIGAQASTVTSIAGGTVIDMPTVNLRTGTMQSLGPAITWSTRSCATTWNPRSGPPCGSAPTSSSSWARRLTPP